MKKLKGSSCLSLLTLAAVCAVGSAASFAAIAPGTYVLRNHPDGAEAPPLYGMRLDELYDATSGHDVFTFDFNNAMSNMQLTYNGSTIRIFGTVFGGRDIGSAYANDAYRGIYTVDFLYNVGVSGVPGDDDLWVNTANHSNHGTIDGPGSLSLKNLVDERGSNPYSFRLGNEDNDLGHRGFNGTSGWGWLSYVRSNGEIRHTDSSDWLFTLGPRVVPAPAAVVLGMLGMGMINTFRRKIA